MAFFNTPENSTAMQAANDSYIGSGQNPTPTGDPSTSDGQALYPGLGRRTAAYLIDLLIVATLALAAVFALVYVTRWMEWATFIGTVSVFTAVNFAYHLALDGNAWARGTLGKVLFRLQVVDIQGRPISRLRAAKRALFRLIGPATLGLAYLVVMKGAKSQSIHDMAAGTLVLVRGFNDERVHSGLPAGRKKTAGDYACLVAAMLLIGFAALTLLRYFGQEATLRHQLQQAYQETSALRGIIADTMNTDGQFPPGINGLAQFSSPFIKGLAYDPQRGSLKVFLRHASFQGKSVVLLPLGKSSSGAFAWACEPDVGISVSALPEECRPTAPSRIKDIMDKADKALPQN